MVGRRHANWKAPGFGLAFFLALIALCSLTVVGPSFALRTGGPSNFSLGGNATVAHPGNGSPTAAELTAAGSAESHVNLAVPEGLKLRQLSSLATDYRFVAGSCASGSPRFTANLTNAGRRSSVFFYIGPANNGGCGASAYTNTGNLAAPTGLADAGQLPGGSHNEPFSKVQNDYGSYTVTAVHIDVDGGEGGTQTVDFDNTILNGKLVTYEPRHGISVLVERTAGTIRVKEPGSKKGFQNFKKVESVQVNSLVDTRAGRVQVTAATGDLGGTNPDDSIVFYDGLIRLKQSGAHDARAVAKLAGKLQCPKQGAGEAEAGKSGGPVATTSRRRGRRVWGSGGGKYKTSGSGGTGSVVGTTWLTKDTCHGTFFRVTDGIGISVRDFDLGRTVELGPGQTYFARNR